MTQEEEGQQEPEVSIDIVKGSPRLSVKTIIIPSWTRRKLSEARYFLERMSEKQDKELPFIYNLNAFLVAFRSTTFFLQKEYKKYPDFKSWYQAKREDMNEDAWMQVLKKQRTNVVHEKPVEIHHSVHTTFRDPEGTLRSYTISGDPELLEVKTTPPANQPGIRHQWLFHKIPEMEVLMVCQKCLKKVEEIIREAEERFRGCPPKSRPTITVG